MREPLGLLLLLTIFVLDAFEIINMWTPHTMFLVGFSIGLYAPYKEQV